MSNEENRIILEAYKTLSELAEKDQPQFSMWLAQEKLFKKLRNGRPGVTNVFQSKKAATSLHTEGLESIVVYTDDVGSPDKKDYTVMNVRAQDAGYHILKAFNLNYDTEMGVQKFQPIEEEHLKNDHTQARLLRPLYVALYH